MLLEGREHARRRRGVADAHVGLRELLGPRRDPGQDEPALDGEAPGRLQPLDGRLVVPEAELEQAECGSDHADDGAAPALLGDLQCMSTVAAAVLRATGRRLDEREPGEAVHGVAAGVVREGGGLRGGGIRRRPVAEPEVDVAQARQHQRQHLDDALAVRGLDGIGEQPAAALVFLAVDEHVAEATGKHADRRQRQHADHRLGHVEQAPSLRVVAAEELRGGAGPAGDEAHRIARRLRVRRDPAHLVQHLPRATREREQDTGVDQHRRRLGSVEGTHALRFGSQLSLAAIGPAGQQSRRALATARSGPAGADRPRPGRAPHRGARRLAPGSRRDRGRRRRAAGARPGVATRPSARPPLRGRSPRTRAPHAPAPPRPPPPARRRRPHRGRASRRPGATPGAIARPGRRARPRAPRGPRGGARSPRGGRPPPRRAGAGAWRSAPR